MQNLPAVIKDSKDIAGILLIIDAVLSILLSQDQRALSNIVRILRLGIGIYVIAI